MTCLPVTHSSVVEYGEYIGFHISIPTIPALARARAHLDRRTGREVTLVITGGLRVAEDFAKETANQDPFPVGCAF